MGVRIIRKIANLFHTVKYFRWEQILFRIYYRYSKRPKLKRYPVTIRTWSNKWSAPAYFPDSILSNTDVTFLGEVGHVRQVEDWNSQEKSKLWLYNLHYFDALNAENSHDHFDVINDFIQQWIQDNPPNFGNGWEPYPLSLRIVNFVKWFSKYPSCVLPEWLDNLVLQTEALVKQPEYQSLANHLFANGKAILFSASFFEGKRARYWLKKGLKIIDSEMKEQFLADGAHFELSPMYHAILLWDICDLVNLTDISGIPDLKARREQWVGIIKRGLDWLEAMIHPDGDISFFNDATLGIAPRYQQIQAYAALLGITQDAQSSDVANHTLLKDSGYCIVSMGQGNKAFLDVGKIGPDYQPGHAHADTLSFELSLYNQRVFVNCGISQYHDSDVRRIQRGTQSHNTVTVNQSNSSEVWAEFRVARRAKPLDFFINNLEPDKIIVNCAHDGYMRLKSKSIHNRQWCFMPNSITIEDTLSGERQPAIAYFFLHPEIRVSKHQDNRIELLTRDDKKILVSAFQADQIHIEPGFWHPSFGVSIPNACLAMHFSSKKLITKIEW